MAYRALRGRLSHGFRAVSPASSACPLRKLLPFCRPQAIRFGGLH